MSYLVFRVVPSRNKTSVHDVWSKTGSFLGQVSWYAPWRRYTFRPSTVTETIFDATCMDEISTFIKELMAARKADQA